MLRKNYKKIHLNIQLLSDVKVLSSKFEGNPNILLEIACIGI